MKCQSLFSEKTKKNISCHPLNLSREWKWLIDYQFQNLNKLICLPADAFRRSNIADPDQTVW